MNKQDLIQKIKQLEGISQDERAYLIDLVNTKKKYGLVWEDKPEDVEELLRENLPVLKEVKEKSLINGEENPNHILIEGDNLHALTALTFTHEGKIDVIYIDPPYNTGNKDFKYNDRFVDKEDSYRHSKWLSFINKRLRIAKRLLSENGVIFISIDDNSQSQLKLLLDEIFGESNFIADLIRKTKSMTGDEGSGVNIQHENLLLYAKQKNNIFLRGEIKNFDSYKNPDNDKYGPWTSGDPSAKSGGDSTFFEIKNPINGHIDLPPIGRYWAFSKNTLIEYVSKGKIVFKDKIKKNERGFIFKRYQNELKSVFNPVGSLFFMDNEYMNQTGTKELKLILEKDLFNNPKPLIFVKKIIEYSTSKNSFILDFFAGSGTTLDATMALNEEDGGNRQCILVTNNENNICEEVTYERNKRVIEGYTNAKGLSVEGLKNNNLRYFKSEYVSREQTLKNKKELTYLATELLCIKEDCYSEVTEQYISDKKQKWVKLFANQKSQMVVIYDDLMIEDSIAIIQALNKNKQNKEKIKVYVFSNGQYPYTEDFEDVLPFITLCALPDAIYKAYQNVLPKKQRKELPVLEDEVDGETDLFTLKED